MAQYTGKYYRSHWEGCLCAHCEESYKQHNQNRVCNCDGCKHTRPYVMKTTREVMKVATVNFCERCNTMGKSSAMGELNWTPDRNQVRAEGLELCPGCVGDLVNFLAGNPVGAVKDQDRPKAYNKPWEEPFLASPTDKLSDEELAREYLARVAKRETAHELEASDPTLPYEPPARDYGVHGDMTP